MSDLVAYIGDVHLDEGEAAVGEFIAFLDRLALRARRIVLMGDLFNLWVAAPEFEGSHQRQVVEALVGLPTPVDYIEGNRDYRIGKRYRGQAFDQVTAAGLSEQVGERRIFAIHGDLANTDDRQYRTWRRVSRSGLVWGLLHLLPRQRRKRLADDLERRMRTTNLNYKQEFPEEIVRRYAATFLARGHDTVVLGHFHVERQLSIDGASKRGEVYVLPEWKGSRRHLEVDGSGIGFVDS